MLFPVFAALLCAAASAADTKSGGDVTDLQDAPPLVKPQEPPAGSTPTPTPTATAPPDAGDGAAPAPAPVRKKEEGGELQPDAVPIGAPTEDLEDKEPTRPVEELKDAPPLVPKEQGEIPGHHPILGDAKAPILDLSSRLDVALLTGGSVQQGWSVPSVRMTAEGATSESVHYRLSLGETREFSSAQLPQILPVEGYIELRQHWGEGETQSGLQARVGIFTPAGSPWWAPDLSEIDLPDYHEIDKAELLSRDIGAQLTYQPWSDRLSVSIGIFNGTGILALDTNNAHALTAAIEGKAWRGPNEIDLGGSVYQFNQASSGSTSYESNLIGDLYLRARLDRLGCVLTAEALGGSAVDSTRTASPIGGAVTAEVAFAPWGRAFGRLEDLANSGSGTGSLRHFQLGPVFAIDRGVEAWLLYDYFDFGSGNGAAQQQAYLRVRLTL